MPWLTANTVENKLDGNISLLKIKSLFLISYLVRDGYNSNSNTSGGQYYVYALSQVQYIIQKELCIGTCDSGYLSEIMALGVTK